MRRLSLRLRLTVLYMRYFETDCVFYFCKYTAHFCEYENMYEYGDIYLSVPVVSSR